jgi:uncharacterized protein (UPF0303 family)
MPAPDPEVAARLVEEITAQEARLQFDRFDCTVAWRLGTAMVEAATQRALPIAIGIRLNGQRLFHAALPGASADNDGWLERKAAVTDRFGHASYLVGLRFRAEGKDFDVDARLPRETFAAHGGVFPIIVWGVGSVGTVGVSGLPQAEDHAFVVEQLEAFLGAGG